MSTTASTAQSTSVKVDVPVLLFRSQQTLLGYLKELAEVERKAQNDLNSDSKSWRVEAICILQGLIDIGGGQPKCSQDPDFVKLDPDDLLVELDRKLYADRSLDAIGRESLRLQALDAHIAKLKTEYAHDPKAYEAMANAKPIERHFKPTFGIAWEEGTDTSYKQTLTMEVDTESCFSVPEGSVSIENGRVSFGPGTILTAETPVGR